MHQYRVTKYNPDLRNALGAYVQEEWTSFGDIGRSIRNVPLSEEEYLRAESAYIETAKSFLAEDAVSELCVVGIENSGAYLDAPIEGAVIAQEDFAEMFRSVLREKFWCKFETQGRFVHFGWDFYMYICVSSRCEHSIAKAIKLGLFVEKFKSPYQMK